MFVNNGKMIVNNPKIILNNLKMTVRIFVNSHPPHFTAVLDEDF
jgi:hypothetical protein